MTNGRKREGGRGEEGVKHVIYSLGCHMSKQVVHLNENAAPIQKMFTYIHTTGNTT